ncbi:MAG: HutD family protein [Synergistaceae bacterium]|jgi:environmental stress-induced protein Ves|nr:HutD family protein [Synergistaceae bacterium]
MKAGIELVRRDEQPVGTWAGGTTTQLALWPPGSDYGRRDFLWRVSTARVDLEESPFTPLPGFHRLLMILEGGVSLVHETEGFRRERTLRPFEQDAFEGEWSTVSRGRCVDFNLMTAPGCAGRIEALRSARKAAAFVLFAELPDIRGKQPSFAAEAFYCLEPLRVRGGEKHKFEIELEQGDFLAFREEFPWEPAEAFFERLGAGGESGVWGIRTTVVC